MIRQQDAQKRPGEFNGSTAASRAIRLWLSLLQGDAQLLTREDTMVESPYSRFDKVELILRDELAIDRTILANERTLLAYLRSGVALLIAGVTMMHFAQEGWFRGVGLACIPTGIVTAVFGVIRYRHMRASISSIRRRLKSEAKSAQQEAGPSAEI